MLANQAQDSGAETFPHKPQEVPSVSALCHLQGFAILDGGMGTELQNSGADVGHPLWSAISLLDEQGRALIKRVHRDFLNSGADVLITNSYKLSRQLIENLPADKIPEGLTPADAARLLTDTITVANEAVADFWRTAPCDRRTHK